MKEFDIHAARTAAAAAGRSTAGQQAAGTPAHADGDQVRCGCGALFARIVREGLELKCRKCKSLVLITHLELVEMYRALDFDGPSDRSRR